MFTSVQRQKLARQKSILKYSNDSAEEDASNNSLGDDLLNDDLLSDDSPTYIDSDIDMDTKAKSNLDEDMTGNKVLKKNSGINIKDLFQQV